MPNSNREISIKRWILFLLPMLAFLGGGLVYSVTIGSMYGKAITRLDTVERVAAGNLGKNLQLEEVMRSEIRAVRDYMFSLNTNIVVIGTALNIAADKLHIIKIEKTPAHKDRINE